jgi:hypothetical protein
MHCYILYCINCCIVELSLFYGWRSTRSSWYRAPLWGPWPDFILILSSVTIALLFFLTTGRVCNLQCNRWLVRSLRTNNDTLPSHLRLCSLFVASYGSQGLRWRYSNPPPHGVAVLSKVDVEVTLRPTVGQSASPSWCQEPIWDPWPISHSPWDFLLNNCGLLFCSVLSDERTGL